MAVITSLPGLRVTVESNGVAAEEHEHPHPQEDNSRTMVRENFDLPPDYEGPLPHLVRYIEAKPGEEFEFVVVKEADVQGQSHHLGFGFYIDGELANRSQEYPDAPSRAWRLRVGGFSSGNQSSGYRRHNYQFKELRLTQGDDLSTRDLQRQTSLAQECGMLRVVVQNMEESRFLNSFKPHKITTQFKVTELPEEALKGLTTDCATSLTSRPRDPPEPRRRRQWNYSDPERRPFAVFDFIYRLRGQYPRLAYLPSATHPTLFTPPSENSQQTAPATRTKRSAKAITDAEPTARYKVRRTEDGREETNRTDV
ncbi:uncharacterized protein B0H64DRAFT_447722 [Chaetomium fimeti]|uniref:DUF7918 domain-containing protein n=1 Tax=Chaetomium fimeti TaxID=1854472 RepID=A0AAE0LX06_9PEZI|nr:hypothetical protein B0H64DRAFT_447722 [Chaetomium fimeti]